MLGRSGANEAYATVTGRWVGTRRVQVQREEGGSEVVESSIDDADHVGVGDKVELTLDDDGRAVDWRRAG
jgi:transcription elongation GreA/GreB family factor